VALLIIVAALVTDKVFFEQYGFLELLSYIGRMLWLLPAILLLLSFTVGCRVDFIAQRAFSRCQFLWCNWQ
jgi:hypothetical protein